MSDKISKVVIDTDLLIIGGGAAGCYAAVVAKETNPSIDVTIMEKAHIERSGCLAAGINAINAYLNPGETSETFLEYVKKDSSGLVRDDLVYTIAEGLNEVTRKVESWGLPILKDEEGNYVARGKRSIRINGERFKPIIARAALQSGTRILNRVAATNYIVVDNRVVGAYGLGVRDGKFYIIRAKGVICATGGAAGIYRPNNDGSASHKMWYSPFNTGTGYAMGIRAGAEMTGFEMRFIALRVKDTIAPTGTLAQGVSAPQINAKGEKYLQRWGKATTPQRLQATLEENQAGRGPCYLDTSHLTPQQANSLKEAYLNMCPGMVLAWADYGVEPNKPLEIGGSEPYIVGGHTQSGYWVDIHRRTTLAGLYAAGDVAGGSPKKYVTGCFVEGKLAAQAALEYIKGVELTGPSPEEAEMEIRRVFAPLRVEQGFLPTELEEALQKLMDEYAGGIGSGYLLNEEKLLIAREKLVALKEQAHQLTARDSHDLVLAHEVIDRIDVARVLVEHLLHRKETRWPCYQTRTDFPQRDDENWLKFVNSVYDPVNDGIRMVERELIVLSS
ncbi:MAG: adenylyl-sulfate reductase subunit alpha [Clostridia bacterium]|nr:adenylyl-sulfate reductase subunit alpha [Clostridia bacterium]